MYEILTKHRKAILITVAVLAACGILWAVYYTYFLFHIVSISPSADSVSTLAPSMVITFNKPLDTSSVRITSSDESVSINTSGRTVTLNFLEIMNSGQPYTIIINSVSSTSKDIIKNYQIQFTPSSDDSYLTPDQITTLEKKQDQVRIPVLNDPIYNYLPYSTLDYSLDATVNTDNSITITITIQLSAADEDSRTAAIAQYTQEAMGYLESLQGITLSKYTITTNVIDSN